MTLLRRKGGHLRYVLAVRLLTVPRELHLLLLSPRRRSSLYNQTSTNTPNYSNRHRDVLQHACPVPEPVAAPKNEAAHALLAKHFSGATATSSNKRPASAPSKRKVPTDPKKLAQLQKVEFMKMRHRAVPADPRDKPSSIGIDQRLHVRVSYESDPEVQKIFWFRKVSHLNVGFLFFYPLKVPLNKTVGTGRALDVLARHFNVPTTMVSTGFVVSAFCSLPPSHCAYLCAKQLVRKSSWSLRPIDFSVNKSRTDASFSLVLINLDKSVYAFHLVDLITDC